MKNPFARRFTVPHLTAAEAARQGHVVRLAIEQLGLADAKLFLNGFEVALNGRPIELAVQSDTGLAAVKALLVSRQDLMKAPAGTNP